MKKFLREILSTKDYCTSLNNIIHMVLKMEGEPYDSFKHCSSVRLYALTLFQKNKLEILEQLVYVEGNDFFTGP